MEKEKEQEVQEAVVEPEKAVSTKEEKRKLKRKEEKGKETMSVV